MLLALACILSIVLQVRPEVLSEAEQVFNDVHHCLNVIHGEACPNMRNNAVLNTYANLKATSASQADLDNYAQVNKLNVAVLTSSPVFVNQPTWLSPGAAPPEYTLQACTARLNLTSSTVSGLKSCTLKSFGYSYTNTSDSLVLDPQAVGKTLDSNYLVNSINVVLKSSMKWDDNLWAALTNAADSGSYRIDDYIRENYDQSYVLNTDYDYLTFRGVNGEKSIIENIKRNPVVLDKTFFTSSIAGAYISNDTVVLCLVIPPA